MGLAPAAPTRLPVTVPAFADGVEASVEILAADARVAAGGGGATWVVLGDGRGDDVAGTVVREELTALAPAGRGGGAPTGGGGIFTSLDGIGFLAGVRAEAFAVMSDERCGSLCCGGIFGVDS